MAFLGADTDELREAGQKCQEGKETTDEVIAYLRALIMVLRAASFFTGGASAAYAEYLEGTVVPWLEKVSQALGLMAQVLLANAKAQDDASDGRTVDFASLPTYSTPGGALPSQRIEVWDGQLVPPSGSVSGAGTATGAGPFEPAGGGPAGPGVDAVPNGELGTGTVGTGTVGTGTAGTAGPGGGAGPAGGSGAGGVELGTAGPGAMAGPGAPVGLGGPGNDSAGGPGTTDSTELGTGAGIGTGPGTGSGAGPGTGSGPASGPGDGATPGPGEDALSGDVTSYSTPGERGEALGGSIPGADTLGGDSSLGTAGEPVPVEGAESSYGAAAGIAGAAALAGLGGAALAGRNQKDGAERIDELGTTYGRGSRGDGVRELQQRLTDAGYDTRGVDGRWGPDTQRAYEAYREAHPLQIRHGVGYTSPDGFDYQQVTGVRGNPNVTPEFLRETEAVAQRIGARPEHLLAVMSFETGGEFGADTPTKANGTAVGLIQFTPVAREQVGVTRDQLMAMTPTEQLAYVEKYFETRRGPHLATVEGLYTSVLYGTGHTDPDHVLFREGQRGWSENRGLDASGNGEITVGEAAARVNRALAGR